MCAVPGSGVALAEADGDKVVDAGIVLLRLPDRFEPLERPAVGFQHDRHTRALQEEGCLVCHPADDKKGPGFRFQRTDDKGDRDALMNLYHEGCIGCHHERTLSLDRTLPRACGECHVKGAVATISKDSTVAFERDLHALHVEKTDGKCASCHHEETDGNPMGLCGDCHGDAGAGEAPSMRAASHETCVGCHSSTGEAGNGKGPVDCGGCHGGGRWRPALDGPPPKRLVYGQKDRLVMHTSGAGSLPVPFDHKMHEDQAAFCSDCHHKTLKACGDCHTVSGTGEGGGVTLENAMHEASSGRSCVGCHEEAAREKSCAGCHHAISGVPGVKSCEKCHFGTEVPPATGEVASLPPTSDDFPETVVIDSMADEYGPSTLPHRKIVERLFKDSEHNRLAEHFHSEVDTLCSGCHHNTPVGMKPPPCSSCHGDSAHPVEDKPGLKAAYHRQCITCHQKMEIGKTGCADCHSRASEGGER